MIVFFPKTFEPLFGLKKLFTVKETKQIETCKEPYLEDDYLKKELGQWIKSNTLPNETAFVAGYRAQVQAYSCRLSPSIYFNATQTPLAKKRLFLDLSHNKPEIIVIPLFSKYTSLVDEDIRLFIANLVAKDYYFDRCLYSYNLYRIKRPQ